MGDVVNLNRVRKRAERKKRSERAEQNRVLHGIPKPARSSAEALNDKMKRTLDQHRIDTGDGE